MGNLVDWLIRDMGFDKSLILRFRDQRDTNAARVWCHMVPLRTGAMTVVMLPSNVMLSPDQSQQPPGCHQISLIDKTW